MSKTLDPAEVTSKPFQQRCPGCGRLFGSDKAAKWCSDSCPEKARRERRKAAKAADHATGQAFVMIKDTEAFRDAAKKRRLCGDWDDDDLQRLFDLAVDWMAKGKIPIA